MMARYKILLLITMMVGLLSACGPIYKTEYAYVPPHSSVGKMCTAQCLQSKSMCQQMCEMRNENCRAQARMEAREDYREYKHERREEGKRIKKDRSDFDRSYACNSSCDCEPQYNSCYSSCGGQVLERQVCVAFCDKQ